MADKKLFIKSTPMERSFFSLTSKEYPQTIGIMFESSADLAIEFIENAAKNAISDIPRLRYQKSGQNWLLLPTINKPPVFEYNNGDLWSSASKIFNFPLQETLWDIWLVNKRFVLFRCHHALGDGLGLRNFIVNYFCEGGVTRKSVRDRLSTAKKVNSAALIKHIAKKRFGQKHYGEFLLFGEDEQNYKNSNYEFVKRCLEENLNNSVRVVVPVNFRSSGDETPLENNLSAVCLEISKIETLEEKLKSIIGDVGFFHSLAEIGNWLPPTVRKLAATECALKTSFIATNVPISKNKLTCGGIEILRFYGFPALLPGNKNGYALMTYNGIRTFNRITKL